MKQRDNKADRFWDWIARRYDRQVHRDENYTQAVERIAKYLDPGDTVLDYACGPGVVALKIAADVTEVHAIDTSERMIEIGKQRARESEVANVHFAQKTIFDDSLRRESYDVVLAFNILHLLEDARPAVQRASELLKPGGLMISSTPCVAEAGVLLRMLLSLVSRVLPLSHLWKFSTADVEDLILHEGLEILESEAPERTLPIFRVVARKR